jgi:hypothetical protein
VPINIRDKALEAADFARDAMSADFTGDIRDSIRSAIAAQFARLEAIAETG